MSLADEPKPAAPPPEASDEPYNPEPGGERAQYMALEERLRDNGHTITDVLEWAARSAFGV